MTVVGEGGVGEVEGIGVESRAGDCDLEEPTNMLVGRFFSTGEGGERDAPASFFTNREAAVLAGSGFGA